MVRDRMLVTINH